MVGSFISFLSLNIVLAVSASKAGSSASLQLIGDWNSRTNLASISRSIQFVDASKGQYQAITVKDSDCPARPMGEIVSTSQPYELQTDKGSGTYKVCIWFEVSRGVFNTIPVQSPSIRLDLEVDPEPIDPLTNDPYHIPGGLDNPEEID